MGTSEGSVGGVLDSILGLRHIYNNRNNIIDNWNKYIINIVLQIYYFTNSAAALCIPSRVFH